MRINVHEVIVDLRRRPLASGEDPTKDLTLGEVLMVALVAAPPGEVIDGMEKRKRVRLADRIVLAGEANDGMIELSVKEVAQLMELVGKIFTPVAAARAMDLLDPVASERSE